jgi:hypothetical protein
MEPNDANGRRSRRLGRGSGARRTVPYAIAIVGFGCLIFAQGSETAGMAEVVANWHQPWGKDSLAAFSPARY